MKISYTKYFWSFLFLLALAPTLAHDNAEKQKFVQSSDQLIKSLASNLKMELGSALKTEGVAAAIHTCQIQAPKITHEQSHGAIRIRRTSLKLRNPANAPDTWERETLELFANKLSNGTPPNQLTRTQIIEQDGTETWRYMRAIVTQDICLTCHGDKNLLSTEVKNMLNKAYPSDLATGFNAGDLRGAFSTIKTIQK